MTKLLFVSPHPDDAEIGCGGFIARAVSWRSKVTIAVCTADSELKMVHSGVSVPWSERMTEQADAARALGGVEVIWLNLAPAAEFDKVHQRNFVSAFDQTFAQFDQVYLPIPSYNADHVRVWEAGLAAFRPGKLDRTSLYGYEQPLGWRQDFQAPWFGRRYVQLNQDEINRKSAAIGCHRSQVGGREHSAYGAEASAIWARMRGMEAGVEFAEVLYLVREML